MIFNVQIHPTLLVICEKNVHNKKFVDVECTKLCILNVQNLVKSIKKLFTLNIHNYVHSFKKITLNVQNYICKGDVLVPKPIG